MHHRAKLATKEPLIQFNTLEPNDIKRWGRNFIYQQKLKNYTDQPNHYTRVNPNNIRPLLPSNISCSELQMFTRLRIGHTKLTHSYLLLKLNPPECPFCNLQPFNIEHILDHCIYLQNVRSSIFTRSLPSNLLQTHNAHNISQLHRFLKTMNIHNLI